MKLSELIEAKNMFIGWPCAQDGVFPPQADKWKLIRDGLHCLATVNAFSSELKSIAEKEVLEREKSMSTGIGEGVALPHASIPDLKKPVGLLSTLGQGLDFDSIDHKPARILVLLLVPKNEFRQHIKTLAGIARMLHDADFREQILAQKDSVSLFNLIYERELAYED